MILELFVVAALLGAAITLGVLGVLVNILAQVWTIFFLVVRWKDSSIITARRIEVLSALAGLIAPFLTAVPLMFVWVRIAEKVAAAGYVPEWTGWAGLIAMFISSLCRKRLFAFLQGPSEDRLYSFLVSRLIGLRFAP